MGQERDTGREGSHSQVVLTWAKPEWHTSAGWGQRELTSDTVGKQGKIQPMPRVMLLSLGGAENLESQHREGEEGPWLQPAQG